MPHVATPAQTGPAPTHSRRHHHLVMPLTTLLGLVLVAALAPAASAADPVVPAGATALSSRVTFYGRGYGHGVGMSQYGARGRAIDGQDAAAILTHYYAGTTLGPLPAAPIIRVLVLDKWAATEAKPLRIDGRGSDWTIDGVAGTFPAGARLLASPPATSATPPTSGWRIRVVGVDGAVLLDTVAPKSRFYLRGVSETTVFKVASRRGKNDIYRGLIRVIATRTPGRVSVVNRLPLESYLRGVVPAEMPSSWPAEALRAQAIASRSYAVRKLRPGVSYFDTYDDSRSQVYLGVRAERAASDAAIADTTDTVLWSGQTVVNALFHSTGGGATEDNEKAFVSATGKRVAGPVSYLRGSLDRRDDGSAYDEGAPYATWATRSYKRTTLSAWFAADPRTDVGSLSAIDLRARGVSGRLISVVLIGSKGTKRVSGDVFRAVFNAARPSGDPSLRSTLFDTAPIP